MANLNTSANLTISFNEITNTFVSKHSYKPVISFFNGKHFIATGTAEEEVYIQNQGDYGVFFGSTLPWYIDLILNREPELNKNIYSFEYKLEATQLDGTNVENVNFDEYRVFDEYQNTGVIDLSSDSRRTDQHLRKWRTQVARDILSRNGLQRMCNEYVHLKLTYNNNAVNGERLQLKLYPCLYSFAYAKY